MFDQRPFAKFMKNVLLGVEAEPTLAKAFIWVTSVTASECFLATVNIALRSDIGNAEKASAIAINNAIVGTVGFGLAGLGIYLLEKIGRDYGDGGLRGQSPVPRPSGDDQPKASVTERFDDLYKLPAKHRAPVHEYS